MDKNHTCPSESIGKAAVRSFVTSAAMSIGVFGGLALIGTFFGKKDEQKDIQSKETQKS